MRYLAIIFCLFLMMGCTTKHILVTIPEVLNEDGSLKSPSCPIIYSETNFFSEDTVEGLWFQFDDDGVLVELNKSETTMDAAIKMVQFINTLNPIGN